MELLRFLILGAVRSMYFIFISRQVVWQLCNSRSLQLFLYQCSVFLQLTLNLAFRGTTDSTWQIFSWIM